MFRPWTNELLYLLPSLPGEVVKGGENKLGLFEGNGHSKINLTKLLAKGEKDKDIKMPSDRFGIDGFTVPGWGQLNPQPEPQILMDKLTLPKGRIVEKIGEDHFKFKLPNGRKERSHEEG